MKALFISAGGVVCCFVALGFAAHETSRAVQPAADAPQNSMIGKDAVKSSTDQDPAIGSMVFVAMQGENSVWHGRLNRIDDRWVVVDTEKEGFGVVWIPFSKVDFIRLSSK